MGNERVRWQGAPALVSTDVTGLITSFNKASERLLGYRSADVVGKVHLDSFHDSAELLERASSTTFRSRTIDSKFAIIVENARRGDSTECEWTYTHHSGRHLHVRLTITALPGTSGDISGYFFVLQEILQGLEAAEVLQHQAELLDLANDAILIRDLDRDTITYWNDGAVRLYGWTKREAYGAYIHEFLKTIFPQPLAEIRSTFLERGYWNGELVHTTRDGRTITVSSRWALLRNRDGVPNGSLELNTDITQQKLAQAALKAAHEELELRVGERTAELSDANRRLQVLSQRLMEIQELERRAIARDLHDEIGQALTAIKLNLREQEENVTAAGLDKSVSDSLLILDQVLGHIRNLALDLRPSMLDELGLVPALRWYVSRQAQRAGWTIKFTADDVIVRPSGAVEISCFRVTQEALTNVARHAKASVVEVRLAVEPGRLDLFISDNGIGFDLQSIRAAVRAGTSAGLSGMEERVHLAGGQVTIHSAPAHGTEIHATFPMDVRSRR